MNAQIDLPYDKTSSSSFDLKILENRGECARSLLCVLTRIIIETWFTRKWPN